MESAKYQADAATAAFERADYESVLKMALPHATAGDPDAQCMLALLYQCGFAIDRNVLESERWLLIAAEQNHPVAWNNLGSLYSSKLPELKHHWDDAWTCYQKAKDLGFACAEPYPPPGIDR